MKPDLCLYHTNCDDGFAAAYAVRACFGDDVRYEPVQYGWAPPDVAGLDVLIVDFSYPADVLLAMGEKARRIVVLDHHKTARAALTSFARFDIEGGYRAIGERGVFVHFDMDKAGCRLAWEYCFSGEGQRRMPLWMEHIEDRDLWRFALAGTREVSAALRACPRDFVLWDGFSRDRLVAEGRPILRYIEQIVDNIARTSWHEDIAGYRIPVAACSYDFVSDVGNRLLQHHPDAPFAAGLVLSYGERRYSLRSEDSRVDVAEIARSFGGGGHRNAAGFTMPTTGEPT